MIFIAVKWRIKPEHADSWLETVADFTAATRAEPKNLFFDWSRSVDDPTEYVLLEAFTDDGAGPHVTSDHFQHAMSTLGAYVAERPQIVNFQLDQDDWSRLGELQLDD
ncbi:Quinol monooxygenase YgiN [Quadrisphaera granulorum]|uniref:Quinol monooxygenase YgiN n=1 Tax=Quadrisphaera granulorum TaxID=317664 RepID=A0A316A418_9ACTN|nr:putative quinol monooxygenase [Quadrisphaera granulorum]PWJ52726.1 quinol monooxygenase YgiN [Quadrisphaera granulorum]SZE97548.1 Quinol monooxygenase YgiN [Quadrisphaera granulorum]